MASDSETSVHDRPVSGVRKILRHPVREGGDVLVGFCGPGALVSLVRARWKLDAVPDPGADPQPWADTCARAISQIAVDAGLTDEGCMDATLLLGWGGQLWTLIHMQAIGHPDGVAVLGSGGDIALGVLMNTRTDTDPAQAVTNACQVAIRCNRFCGGPVDVHVLPAAEGR